MLEEKALAGIDEFKARKQAQWKKVADKLPGLQLAQSGERGSQFMLICSTDHFYEGVILGQLPHVVMENYGPPVRPRRRAVPDERKPIERRSIDLTDAQIDQILSLWRSGTSALSLPFVAAVFDMNGLMQTQR